MGAADPHRGLSGSPRSLDSHREEDDHFVNRAERAMPGFLQASLRAVRDAHRRVDYLRARWPRPLGTRPPIELAACAIFRDEARYLAEWVAFHRIQGVER